MTQSASKRGAALLKAQTEQVKTAANAGRDAVSRNVEALKDALQYLETQQHEYTVSAQTTLAAITEAAREYIPGTGLDT